MRGSAGKPSTEASVIFAASLLKHTFHPVNKQNKLVLWISPGLRETKGGEHLVDFGLILPYSRNKKWGDCRDKAGHLILRVILANFLVAFRRKSHPPADSCGFLSSALYCANLNTNTALKKYSLIHIFFCLCCEIRPQISPATDLQSYGMREHLKKQNK